MIRVQCWSRSWTGQIKSKLNRTEHIQIRSVTCLCNVPSLWIVFDYITKHRWLFWFVFSNLSQTKLHVYHLLSSISHLCVTSCKTKGKFDSGTDRTNKRERNWLRRRGFFEQEHHGKSNIAVPTDEQAPAPTPGMQLSWLQATKSSVSSMETFATQASAYWDPSNDDKIRVHPPKALQLLHYP